MFLNNVISYLHSLNPDFHNKDNSHIEIEIKLLLDKRIKVPYFIKIHEYPNDLKNKIMDIIQNALKYGISDISQTINFINTTNKNGMFVKQLHFINGIQDKDKKNYYYKKLIENGVNDYSYLDYENDLKDAISYFPFFVAVWFGTTPQEELIDVNFPFFLIQKLFYFLTQFY